MRKNEPIMSSMFCGITHTSKLLSDMRKICVRETVEQAKRYPGCAEEVIVIGISDSAIRIGEELATSTNHST